MSESLSDFKTICRKLHGKVLTIGSLSFVKRSDNEDYLVLGLILATLLCSIPFTQSVEVTEVFEETPQDWQNIIWGFGGPRVTWAAVELNRTAEIRFMYPGGIGLPSQLVLLDSKTSDRASYNYNAEHHTVMIGIITEGPVHLWISYTYEVETVRSIFGKFLGGET